MIRFVPFITLRMIQDNIALAQKHDAVDTVVEAGGYKLLKAQMVSLLQIFQIVLIFTKDRLHKHSVVKTFIDLYGSLSAEEKEILTDACKIFVIKGKDVAWQKVNTLTLKLQHYRLEDC